MSYLQDFDKTEFELAKFIGVSLTQFQEGIVTIGIFRQRVIYNNLLYGSEQRKLRAKTLYNEHTCSN